MLEKAAKIFVILPQVFPQSIEPCTAFIVSGYRGDNAERINVAHFVDVDGAVDTAAYPSSAAMMLAICNPARLNALLGETQVTEFWRKRSDREAKGV